MRYTSYLPIIAILLKLGRLAVEHTEWLATLIVGSTGDMLLLACLFASRHNRKKELSGTLDVMVRMACWTTFANVICMSMRREMVRLTRETIVPRYSLQRQSSDGHTSQLPDLSLMFSQTEYNRDQDEACCLQSYEYCSRCSKLRRCDIVGEGGGE